mgnify:CR=1 FL=1
MTTILHYKSSPLALLATHWRNRSLIVQMVRREISSRYKGSVLGILWAFIQPLILLLVYTFVFSEVFNARWGTQVASKTDFALALFTGITIYNLFAEVATRSPSLIISHANYVKKIIFPLETLPAIAIGSASVQMLISIATILVINFVLNGSFSPAIAALPFILLPYVLFIAGLSWLLAALGVYIRDIGQSVSLITSVSMFLSPIFYPISALPEKYQVWLHLNPLTLIIEESRKVILWNTWPDWLSLAKYSAASAVLAALGFFWFQRSRKGFADVL